MFANSCKNLHIWYYNYVRHLINQKKAFSNQILCVTFTNKAAREMQNRVMEYIKGSSNAIHWLGTFHAIRVKFLRRHAEALGY